MYLASFGVDIVGIVVVVAAGPVEGFGVVVAGAAGRTSSLEIAAAIVARFASYWAIVGRSASNGLQDPWMMRMSQMERHHSCCTTPLHLLHWIQGFGAKCEW